ncbi:hypothetical protein [Flavobacterium sp. MK4S-17]|uniref:hypothetical protein n=1 Tax=Flavobacterium sp. MK4S-17 TaxID=2543737 RepID=UPI001356FA04|nr:hypothetical protein [Flavobacterium sp. MK4S-17]
MKIIFIIFILIANLNLYSQDLEHLAKQDTIYIVLKDIDKNYSKQYEGFKYRSTVYPKFSEFQLTGEDGIPIIIHAPKAYPVYSVKKKIFTHKNIFNIIDLEYIEKIGIAKLFAQTLGLINPSRKIFFVLDEEDLKKKYVRLKKVEVIGVLFSKI